MRTATTTLLTPIPLTQRQSCDLDLILDGAFGPNVTGWMCRDDYESVVNNLRLHNDVVFPIPIVLGVSGQQLEKLFGESLEDIFSLNSIEKFIDTYKECNQLSQLTAVLTVDDREVAIMHVEDIYKPDLDLECEKVFGTLDRNHPYVDLIQSHKSFPKGVYYIGGRVERTRREIDEYRPFENDILTPKQCKEYISHKDWRSVIGFQTRNPMHNCHLELTKIAIKRVSTPHHKAALLLQPIIGVTQPQDVDYRVRVRCYKELLNKYKEDGIDVKLSLLRLSMRMAGPREALWHAIIRKQFGCTHFIVGRDHAGPSTKTKEGHTFYGPYDAHALVNKFSDEIGIEVITSRLLTYNHTTQAYLQIIDAPDNNNEHISGTELRRRLRNSEVIPEWFTQPRIASILREYYIQRNSKGIVYYFIGLSGAGKTTIAKAFAKKLEEFVDPSRITILDGDEVRTNISSNLGFSRQDRATNVRRIGYIASLLAKSGGIVLCANIAPYQTDRDWNRRIISKESKYVEVYVKTDLSTCEERDVKGLYKLARQNKILQFTGISDPFEYPTNYDISLEGSGGSDVLRTNLDRLTHFLE